MLQILQNMGAILGFYKNFLNFRFFLNLFCKMLKINLAHFVDLEKCCKMSIWLQKSALIQPRTSPLKFANSATAAACRSTTKFSEVPLRGGGPRGRCKGLAAAARRVRPCAPCGRCAGPFAVFHETLLKNSAEIPYPYPTYISTKSHPTNLNLAKAIETIFGYCRSRNILTLKTEYQYIILY